MYDLKNCSLTELEHLVTGLGAEPYRAKQIFQWLFQKNADDITGMTDLSEPMRNQLKKQAFISKLVLTQTVSSRDGSKKYLFATPDGHGIESVLIPEKNHATLCISSQIGCPVGCRFCYTGRNGLVRNLSAAEILNQVSAVLQQEGPWNKLPNLVFMGMGEPLANYHNTLKAITTLMTPFAFNISHRKITVSTAGLVPRIIRLGRDMPVNLAISLNAPNDTIRNDLMPINRKHPLKELLNAAREFPLVSRKPITFEYILIKDINDADKHAFELTGLLKNISCKINLIPFNEHPAITFKAPAEKRITAFLKILHDHDYTATIRRSKGADIAAACGQLGGQLKPAS
ncbi:MAG: 23S rRNA (adenine(2503)-C(2))-methyltransferase RlmN [Deltaproteobacteria bacterium]|nr:23S rRNA (adenine(2503)-C(2))-methyltransferase RlmN [Deltaproteobacteria bacterium]